MARRVHVRAAAFKMKIRRSGRANKGVQLYVGERLIRLRATVSLPVSDPRRLGSALGSVVSECGYGEARWLVGSMLIQDRFVVVDTMDPERCRGAERWQTSQHCASIVQKAVQEKFGDADYCQQWNLADVARCTYSETGDEDIDVFWRHRRKRHWR